MLSMFEIWCFIYVNDIQIKDKSLQDFKNVMGVIQGEKELFAKWIVKKFLNGTLPNLNFLNICERVENTFLFKL